MLYLVKGRCEQTIVIDGETQTVEVEFKGGALWEGGMITFSKAPKYTYTAPSGTEIHGFVKMIPTGTKLRFEVNDYERVFKVVETDGFRCMVQQ